MATLVPCMAQQRGHRNKAAMRKEMREFKMKFLAQEMDLKDDQKDQFSEIYSEMMKERLKVFQEIKDQEYRLKNEKDISEKEYAEMSKSITAAKERDAALEKRYDEKFSKFLTSKQIFKMKEAENKWRDKMHEMRHKSKMKNQPKK